jgi:predicted GIY-YIG superfamily endonuclease
MLLLFRASFYTQRKGIKKWKRLKKEALINKKNPEWNELVNEELLKKIYNFAVE